MTTSGSEIKHRHGFDLLLDLGVFAPLGFLVKFPRIVPDFAQAGREHLDTSRSIGRMTLAVLERSRQNAARRDADAGADTGTPSSEIDGYDGLSARDVIALAKHASDSQRRWMRRREQATKARKTVLAALGPAEPHD